jgi:hypothetical protein
MDEQTRHARRAIRWRANSFLLGDGTTAIRPKRSKSTAARRCFPNSLFDAQKARDLWQMFLREHEYASEMGFDGSVCNEHHNNVLSIQESVNLSAAVISQPDQGRDCRTAPRPVTKRLMMLPQLRCPERLSRRWSNTAHPHSPDHSSGIRFATFRIWNASADQWRGKRMTAFHRGRVKSQYPDETEQSYCS